MVQEPVTSANSSIATGKQQVGRDGSKYMVGVQARVSVRKANQEQKEEVEESRNRPRSVTGR